MKLCARTALTLALALASGTAAALGLGQIEVKSRLGEPFLAEIPIVSNDPGELENLQAELASPVTFERIGLRAPTGIVADLQFASALDGAGNPVIRVTSQQPVDEPLLTFLVSVDWGQGRLVREYSALLDTPNTVSAPLQPAIDEAMVSAPNLIERPAEPSAATSAPNTADSDTAANPDAIAATPAAAAQSRVAIASPQRRVAEPIGDAYAVRRGDTLSQIAGRMRSDGGYTLDQTMIALLRANPEAFIDGNINRLKAGAVLRVPPQAELAGIDAQQARQLVSSQVQQWRDARRAVPQPATAVVEGAPAGPGATDITAVPRLADARLEIVPPGAAQASQAGTQSGIQAGGEGDMVRQELQARETLAAREAEVQELKSRIGELEQLQQKQQQLIAMKDSELAAAQQRLAQREQAEAGASALPWLGGAAALVLAMFGGWWLLRRRPARPVFRAPIAAAEPSLADEFAPPAKPRSYESEPALPDAASDDIGPRSSADAKPVLLFAAAAGEAARSEPSLALPPGLERLELARAYLDLGDRDSARQLLQEVAADSDLAARQLAARMLQELE